MRKTIKTESERTVHVCDFCGKQADNPNKCWVCRRECCWSCSKLLFCGHGADLIDLSVHTCPECRKHGQLIDKIQAVLDVANKQLADWTGLWKAAARAELAKQGGDTP